MANDAVFQRRPWLPLLTASATALGSLNTVGAARIGTSRKAAGG